MEVATRTLSLLLLLLSPVVARSPDRATSATAGLLEAPVPLPRKRCERDIGHLLPLRQIPRRGRKSPMLRSAYQPTTTGIIVDIVDLLLPERFVHDGFRMAARLPKAALAVGSGLLTQGFGETAGELLLTIIAQLSPGELPEIGERLSEPFRIEVSIKHDQVQMRRHDDEGVDAQVLLAMAKSQAIRDDLASSFADEDGQPLDDGVRDEIDGGFGVNAVTLHDDDCRLELAYPQRTITRVLGGGGDLRSGAVARSGDRATTRRPCHNEAWSKVGGRPRRNLK